MSEAYREDLRPRVIDLLRCAADIALDCPGCIGRALFELGESTEVFDAAMDKAYDDESFLGLNFLDRETMRYACLEAAARLEDELAEELLLCAADLGLSGGDGAGPLTLAARELDHDHAFAFRDRVDVLVGDVCHDFREQFNTLGHEVPGMTTWQEFGLDCLEAAARLAERSMK